MNPKLSRALKMTLANAIEKQLRECQGELGVFDGTSIENLRFEIQRPANNVVELKIRYPNESGSRYITVSVNERF